MASSRKTPDWTARTRRVLVVGPSGSGKSSWLEVFLRGNTAQVHAFDHKGEMGRRYGLPVWSDPDQAPRALTWSQAFNPHHAFPGRVEEAFAWWCQAVWAAVQRLPGDQVVIVDELQDWVRPGKIPLGLSRLIQSGRAWRVHVVCLAQSVNEVTARLRGQFTEAVAFRCLDQRALMWLSYYGFVPADIQALAPLHYRHRNLANGVEQTGRIEFVASRAVIRPAAHSARPEPALAAR